MIQNQAGARFAPLGNFYITVSLVCLSVLAHKAQGSLDIQREESPRIIKRLFP